MRVLFYSDLHIRPQRFADCVRVLNEIPELVKKYKVDLVVNGGDTFETRGLIETHCLQALHRVYTDWHNEGIKQYILVGNHDQEDRDGNIHPMEVFQKWSEWPHYRQIDTKSLARVMARVTSKLGLEGKTLYGFRHTFVTDLVTPSEDGSRSGNIEAARIAAGHTNINQTKHYTHFEDKTVRSELNKAAEVRNIVFNRQAEGVG